MHAPTHHELHPSPRLCLNHVCAHWSTCAHLKHTSFAASANNVNPSPHCYLHPSSPQDAALIVILLVVMVIFLLRSLSKFKGEGV